MMCVDVRPRVLAGVAILVCWEFSYMLHDTWSMLLQHCRHARALNTLMMLHHSGLLGILPVYFFFQRGDFYIACLYTMNASTPLLHARWMLKMSRLRGSVVHKTCAILLLIVFFIARILLFPFLFAVHAYQSQGSVLQIHRLTPLYCLATAVAMTSMNIMWWFSLYSSVIAQDLRMKYDPARATWMSKVQ
jgi:TLC domain